MTVLQCSGGAIGGDLGGGLRREIEAEVALSGLRENRADGIVLGGK